MEGTDRDYRDTTVGMIPRVRDPVPCLEFSAHIDHAFQRPRALSSELLLACQPHSQAGAQRQEAPRCVTTTTTSSTIDAPGVRVARYRCGTSALRGSKEWSELLLGRCLPALAHNLDVEEEIRVARNVPRTAFRALGSSTIALSGGDVHEAALSLSQLQHASGPARNKVASRLETEGRSICGGFRR